MVVGTTFGFCNVCSKMMNLSCRSTTKFARIMRRDAGGGAAAAPPARRRRRATETPAAGDGDIVAMTREKALSLGVMTAASSLPGAVKQNAGGSKRWLDHRWTPSR